MHAFPVPSCTNEQRAVTCAPHLTKFRASSSPACAENTGRLGRVQGCKTQPRDMLQVCRVNKIRWIFFVNLSGPQLFRDLCFRKHSCRSGEARGAASPAGVFESFGSLSNGAPRANFLRYPERPPAMLTIAFRALQARILRSCSRARFAGARERGLLGAAPRRGARGVANVLRPASPSPLPSPSPRPLLVWRLVVNTFNPQPRRRRCPACGRVVAAVTGALPHASPTPQPASPPLSCAPALALRRPPLSHPLGRVPGAGLAAVVVERCRHDEPPPIARGGVWSRGTWPPDPPPGQATGSASVAHPPGGRHCWRYSW